MPTWTSVTVANRRSYAVCGPTDCPHDERFVHENLFGRICVPSDFSFTTGRSRKVKQVRINGRWRYPGGCSAIVDGLLAAFGHG